MLSNIGRAYFSQNMGEYSWNFNKENLSQYSWMVVLNPHPQNQEDQSAVSIAIFQKMVKAEVGVIYTSREFHTTILMSIAHIEFLALKLLALPKNQIVNIEVMATLNCPSIETIYIDRNKISNVRALRKFKANQLRRMILKQNPINELNYLREWNNSNLTAITLEFCSEGAYCLTALSTFAAFQSHSFQQIWHEQNLRVTQMKPWRMLSQKYGRQLKGRRFNGQDA